MQTRSGRQSFQSALIFRAEKLPKFSFDLRPAISAVPNYIQSPYNVADKLRDNTILAKLTDQISGDRRTE